MRISNSTGIVACVLGVFVAVGTLVGCDCSGDSGREAKVSGAADKGELRVGGDEQSAGVEKRGATRRRRGRGRKKKRFPHALTYVDGEVYGVARYGELPPGVQPVWFELSTGDKVRRFRWADYLEALGLKLDDIRELHLYGGRSRVSVVEGSEVSENRKDFKFSFTRGNEGRLRVEWADGVERTSSLDKVSAVAVYVDKTPPKYNEEVHRLELNGEVLERVPYAEKTKLVGARVYVDGRLVGTIGSRSRRRQQGEREARPLANGLKALDVDVDAVGTVDLVDRDEFVKRISADKLGEMTYEGAPGARGRIRLQPFGGDATALLMYAEKTPPDWAER